MERGGANGVAVAFNKPNKTLHANPNQINISTAILTPCLNGDGGVEWLW